MNVGKYIAWYNTQFYGDAGYDDTPQSKVNLYNTFAQEIGPDKLVMGVPIDPMVTGAINFADMQNVITQVQGTNDVAPNGGFGGVMTWEFAFDNNGSWGKGIAQALSSEIAQGENYTAPPY